MSKQINQKEKYYSPGTHVVLVTQGPTEQRIPALVVATADQRVVLTVDSSEPFPRRPPPGRTIALEITRKEECVRVSAEVSTWTGPDRVELTVTGEAEPYDRRKFLRVDAEIELGLEVVPLDRIHYARRDVLSRPRIRMSDGGEWVPTIETPSGVARDAWAQLILERLLVLEERVAGLHRMLEGDSGPRRGGKRNRPVSLSGGGMRIRDDQPYPQGTVLHVVMNLPLPIPVEIALLSEVMRSEEVPSAAPQDRYEIICQFDTIKERDRDEIVRYTYQRQREFVRGEPTF